MNLSWTKSDIDPLQERDIQIEDICKLRQFRHKKPKNCESNKQNLTTYPLKTFTKITDLESRLILSAP